MTAINKDLVTEEQLAAWLGYDSTAAIERRLREMGIRFRRSGKGEKIVTTLAAIDRAIAGNDDFGDIQFGRPDGSEARKQG